MTAHRFHELRMNPFSATPEEHDEFLRILAHYHRSNAANQAVSTKRRRYTTWPTRRCDHLRIAR